jgi:hypothetical protein
LLHVGSLVVVTQPTHPTAHTRGRVAPGSDKQHFSDKIMILYKPEERKDILLQEGENMTVHRSNVKL